MAQRAFEPKLGDLALMAKDLSLATQLAAESGSTPPVLTAVACVYAAAASRTPTSVADQPTAAIEKAPTACTSDSRAEIRGEPVAAVPERPMLERSPRAAGFDAVEIQFPLSMTRRPRPPTRGQCRGRADQRAGH
jgi:hypothetical protein